MKTIIRATTILVVGVFFLIGGLVILFVRSQRGNPGTLDNIAVWKVMDWKETKYTLTHIVGGFQEKVEFVALFRGDVQYDKWGNPKTDNIVFKEPVDLKLDDRMHPTRFSIGGDLSFETNQIVVAFDNGEKQYLSFSTD